MGYKQVGRGIVRVRLSLKWKINTHLYLHMLPWKFGAY